MYIYLNVDTTCRDVSVAFTTIEAIRGAAEIGTNVAESTLYALIFVLTAGHP
jgi:hypothetical protein